MPLFLLFVVIPIIEIALFIQIGGEIGLWTTLAIIIATAAIGSLAIRSQGRAMMRSMMSANVAGATDLLSQGLLLFVAGMFLITPGFLTDFLGLSLLVPPIRRRVRDYLMRRMNLSAVQFGVGGVGDNMGGGTGDGVGDGFNRRTGQNQAWPENERAASPRPPHSTTRTPNENSPWRTDESGGDVEDAEVLSEKQPKR